MPAGCQSPTQHDGCCLWGWKLDSSAGPLSAAGRCHSAVHGAVHGITTQHLSPNCISIRPCEHLLAYDCVGSARRGAVLAEAVGGIEKNGMVNDALYLQLKLT